MVGNHARKLVLLKLADNACDQVECWPSYQSIAEQCEMFKLTVMRHIADLEKAGFI
ncbi:helix-turn-helix domain-containing protein [Pseudoalteromonas obscura]|uniref:Helix-turn-helix domain-containing protein n=1 Tax=Pseudoalteromonas obscura TaxID=3048491 RepID=A0ABT7EK63_9GAMM|nr:helix-turn-helix domain-containing protein [Pseudoalteromonas sp. P94(2023)]MDK2595424.1 helix-turn-helix domain-containing protein [Pseudoalteromonas sp. P94(2023)]